MRTQRTNGTVTYKYTYHGSQLTHMEYNGTELHFSYDAMGNPMAVVYGGNTYYYLLNQQGDVVGILDSSGTQVVAYTYDAWGRPLTTTGSMVSTLGQYNPLRYRGYVWDSETNLYYLQSRYYNPTWGRFLNADSLVSTGQGILGNNMFAYCGNNPVSRIDPSGEIFIDWLKDTWDGMCNFFVNTYEYITNTEENVVLNAEYLAFYKGVPVVKIDAMGNDAFSFGLIIMGNGNSQDVATVKHEYGHTKQLATMGVEMYLATVAAPSLYGYWSRAYGENYYNMPWERMADKLGNVTQSDLEKSHRRNPTYSTWSEPLANGYYGAQIAITILLRIFA